MTPITVLRDLQFRLEYALLRLVTGVVRAVPLSFARAFRLGAGGASRRASTPNGTTGRWLILLLRFPKNRSTSATSSPSSIGKISAA